uniref:Replication-associated protein n=1 Tax=Pavo cristatus Smacoviridae sp. TaxID=2814975 RepID=A0A8A4XDF9_9VIRU
MRIQTRYNFNQLKQIFPKAHIEKCSDTWEYERKEGKFWCSEDTREIRSIRFGRMTDLQKMVMRYLDFQNDRQITVWYDQEGCHGKSWLTIHLWETGRACVVPSSVQTPKEIIQFVCSNYRGQPYIVIDVPRAGKWSEGLYEAIESIKDGLVYDTRYSGRMRNIRGVKILVLTNTSPKPGKLSDDRWMILDQRKLEKNEEPRILVTRAKDHGTTCTGETHSGNSEKRSGGTLS